MLISEYFSIAYVLFWAPSSQPTIHPTFISQICCRPCCRKLFPLIKINLNFCFVFFLTTNSSSSMAYVVCFSLFYPPPSPSPSSLFISSMNVSFVDIVYFGSFYSYLYRVYVERCWSWSWREWGKGYIENKSLKPQNEKTLCRGRETSTSQS